MLSSTKNSVGSPLSQMRAKALLRKKIKALIPMAIGLVLAALTVSGWAEVDVLVGRFDSRGTGANLRETILNTRNVNPSDFGKLFSYEVEGFVYTQPLIVSGMGVRGRQRNVLYVATTNSMVYAVDADDPGPDGGLLWQVRLTDQGAFPAPPHRGSLTIQSNAGILSTPVIDRPRSAIYVVARSLGPTGYVQRLHALDLFTGREKSGSPVEISASVHESGDGLTFTFNPEMQMNRPGLALSGSSVVIAWSPLDADDVDHGHGWVMAYDAGTLHRTGVFCTTCAKAVPSPCPVANGCDETTRRAWLIGGGIWQSGRPPAVDGSGHVYYFVGNGWTLGVIGLVTKESNWYTPACTPDQEKPAGYYGESLLRLDPRRGLALVGSWTPADWCDLEQGDADLGGSGPVLIDVGFPDGRSQTVVVGGGKQGRLYSIDTSRITEPDMVEGKPLKALRGDFEVAAPPLTCPQTHHEYPHHIMGGPVYWPRSGAGRSRLYLSAENDCVRGFAVTFPKLFDSPPMTLTSAVIEGHPGAILSLSADGDRSGSGILWMTYASATTPKEGASFDTRRGRLAAYDAEDLGRELWNSDRAAAGRDTLGYFAKFNPPTIANGKVYVASFPTPEPYKKTGEHTYHAPNSVGYLVVYGLKPPAKPPVKSFVADLLPSILSPLLTD